MKAYGMEKLIEIGVSQLSDQLPESREAARALILELHTAYEKYYFLATCEEEQQYSWEQFCELNLSKLSGQAVLRVTSAGRDSWIVSLYILIYFEFLTYDSANILQEFCWHLVS